MLFRHSFAPDASYPVVDVENGEKSKGETSKGEKPKDAQKVADNNVELVVASMKKENITWLHDYLTDWKKNIYVVDDPTAELTVPLNKGREAMVFLT